VTAFAKARAEAAPEVMRLIRGNDDDEPERRVDTYRAAGKALSEMTPANRIEALCMLDVVIDRMRMRAEHEWSMEFPAEDLKMLVAATRALGSVAMWDFVVWFGGVDSVASSLEMYRALQRGT
jgi:hypothetical protein